MRCFDNEALKKDGETVGQIKCETEAFLPGTSSLKDGLSEIFSHDLEFLIVVDDSKRVIGTLHTDDIKKILRG